MTTLQSKQQAATIHLLNELFDQEKARILVPPQQDSTGFWFGGGNLVQDQAGTLWLCGRYRNFGDSRTGLQAGERGVSCTIFRSDDDGLTFTKVSEWSKPELSRTDRKILSYEGTALHQLADGTWELFISSEKEIAYPEGLQQFQKPGTGVWTIDRITGETPDKLDPDTIQTVFENHERPEYLHIKDPVVFDGEAGQTHLIFCSHPFNWTSSNSGLLTREADDTSFSLVNWEVVSRGAAWDVAATRITGRMPIPAVGCFADTPPWSVYLYDGAECLRQLEENRQAHKRPRGYSCEELSSAMVAPDFDFQALRRLVDLEPMFISPWGTGSSRYGEALVTENGIFATWEQSQADESQPLVGRFLPVTEVKAILA
ncbi:MAG: exo-alpha-sialidase [Chloroflexota bacterium]